MDKPPIGISPKKLFRTLILIMFASLIPFRNCFAGDVIGGSGGSYYSSEACDYEVLNQDSNGMLWGGTGYRIFYCCDADVSNAHESCPRWIVASSSVFAIAWSRRVGSYSAETIDAADKCIAAGQDVLYTGEINAYWIREPNPTQHTFDTAVINNTGQAHAKYSARTANVVYNWNTGTFGSLNSLTYIDEFGQPKTYASMLDKYKYQNDLTMDTSGDFSVAFVCAASVEEEPDDTCSDHAPSSYGDSNATLGTTSTWSGAAINSTTYSSNTLWAKPGDKVSFAHCYFPGAQTVRQSGNVVESSNSFSVSQTKRGVTTNVSGDSFDLTTKKENAFSNSGLYFTGTVGSKAVAKITTKSNKQYSITSSYVGTNLSQTVHTYTGVAKSDGTRTTYNDNASTATVKIPYNYLNTVSISAPSATPYSGESITTGNVTVTTGTRRNTTTGGTYATKSPTARVKIYAFNSASDLSNVAATTADGGTNHGTCTYFNNKGASNCAEIYDQSTISLNSSGNTSGSTKTISGIKYNIVDADAGYYLCFASSVWPANPDGDTDMSAPSNRTVAYSAIVCKQIAHRATFQVWGGSIFSNGSISASYAVKNHVDGYTSWHYRNTSGNYIFASWAENAVIAGGTVTGVASGAATGYTRNESGNLVLDPGGKNTNTLCAISPLTITNKSCSSGTLGNSNLRSTNSYATSIRSKYESLTKNSGKQVATNTWIDLSNSSSYTTSADSKIRYTYANGNLYISSSAELSANITHIVYATGDITIGCGNVGCTSGASLRYYNGPYTSAEQIPQYIIISDKNIYIENATTRVDAQLIADKASTGGGVVKTCNNTSIACNQQLIINGGIVAQQLDLKRTYGSGTGDQSGVPAEIINSSITNYLWTASKAEEKPVSHTVYTREVPARY